MAWERRRNGRLYYYRSRRLPDGRVRKEYLGGGEAGQTAARQDAARLAGRLSLHLQESARQEQVRSLEDLVRSVNDQADALLKTALLSAGWHRPNRHSWRKRHVKQ